MALESATYISQLVDTNPAGSDVISQGDDHLRLIKEVLQKILRVIWALELMTLEE